MSRNTWIYIAAIYLPIIAALLARLVHGRRPRQFAACLLSTIWVAAALPLLAHVNLRAGWWSFAAMARGPAFGNMPLALYLGWIVLWGALPILMFPRMRLRWVLLIMACVDLYGMPALKPIVMLNSKWLLGEAVAVAIVLLPALLLSRWTLDDTHPRGRAVLQIMTAGLLFLFLLPELIFALKPGAGWTPLLTMPDWIRQLSLQTLFLLAVPGISAVLEFADRGNGTPIPYDPPKRLVTSGLYRYVANPMQISCGTVMLAWAALLRNGWMASAAVMSVIYSAGIAEWDERQDLKRRFGAEWVAYRSEVKNWCPRWTPFVGTAQSRIYIASTCGPCSELWRWIAKRKPRGLEILAAEQLPVGSIHRMRYEPGDGTPPVEGIRAFGRALEHLNLGWAYCGALLRLPGLWNAVQMVMDAAGFGPRNPQTSAVSIAGVRRSHE